MDSTVIGTPPPPNVADYINGSLKANAFTGISVIPPATAHVRAAHCTLITVRQVEVGYVAGTFIASKGVPAASVSGADGLWHQPLPYSSGYDPVSGKFMFGPFVPGHAKIIFVHNGSDPQTVVASQTAVVKAGKITYITIHAPPDLSALRQLHGPVFIPGHGNTAGEIMLPRLLPTPAYAAVAELYNARVHAIVSKTLAGADGKFYFSSSGYFSNQFTPRSHSHTPPGVTLIALLPGSYGAVTMHAKVTGPLTPVKLILPPPISIRGLVTFGGKPLNHRASLITVRAQYAGKGYLDDLLSVQTSANADGSFTLGGLTPGPYHIQAAIDNLWVSRTIDIRASRFIPPLRFNISPPGRPVVLICQDARGRPITDARVTVNIRPGPLTSRLLPSAWRTDGGGCVYLAGLSVGTYRVRIGTYHPVVIEVPPLPTHNKTPLTLHATLR